MRGLIFCLIFPAAAMAQQWIYVFDSRFDAPPPVGERGVDVAETDEMRNPDYRDLKSRGINPRAHRTPYIYDDIDGVVVPMDSRAASLSTAVETAKKKHAEELAKQKPDKAEAKALKAALKGDKLDTKERLALVEQQVQFLLRLQGLDAESNE